MDSVMLRSVSEEDLPLFFKYQQDRDANHMAAFTSKDPSDWDSFYIYWNKILKDNDIIKQTIIVDDHVVGNVLCFEQFGERGVAYWIGREFWGKGIATTALRKFLQQVKTRPLFARAAKDNIGSRKVLEKCGFKITGEDSGYANARGENVEEFVFTLN